MNAVAQEAQGAATSQGVFKGMAIVIDDGFDNPRDGIGDVVAGIERNGGYWVKLTALPEADADLENMANASFFIMDWNLTNLPPGTRVPEALMNEQVQKNIAFLRRLKDFRHAPVFIFTHEEPAVVEAALADAELIAVGDAESHIMVHSKAGVGLDVYSILNEWAEKTPSAKLLKTWERNHLRAVNAFFADFHNRSRFWPLIFWEGFKEDEVPPGAELGALVTRLVSARMHPLEIDLEPFAEEARREHAERTEQYDQALTRVIEGERMVPAERLEPTSFNTGDFFKVEENGVTKYYLNVRAECDCVIRGKPVKAELYLLRGKPIDDFRSIVNMDGGSLMEKDVEAVVFGMYEGKSFRFRFSDFSVKTWRELEARRVGRLLPPFVTRVQQRFAAYSQRPGQPRIPATLLERLLSLGEEGVHN